MKIATYNMLHDKLSKQNWSSILDKFDPDVVLAQESLAPDAYRQPLLESDGWCNRVAWSPVNDLWGSAVYFKSEVPTKLNLPGFGGWVVGVQVSDVGWMPQPSRPLQVYSIHAPTGQGEYAAVVNSILEMIAKQRDGCDVVIGGDFNLTVSKRHESESRKNKPANLEIQARLRDEFGLINCWQSANPDTPLAQTLRHNSDLEAPFHCDGIFVPASWAGRLKSCEVLSGAEWKGMSDHNPVVAEFV